MTRVAAIDCGTNSIRLLVADVQGEDVTEVERRSTIVRLGEGIDSTGEITPGALQRTFAALDEYAEVIDRSGAARVRFVATSAARDARNRDEFNAGVRDRVGVLPDVIEGSEEAELSFDGAMRGVVGMADLREPVMVVDIGGGSTELVLGGDDGLVGQSLNIGSVRLTERYLHTDPPSAAELNAAQSEIDRQLDTVSFALAGVSTIVGVAGTATTVTAHVLGLDSYDRARLHQVRSTRNQVLNATQDLIERTVEQRMTLGFMQPGRADVIGAGALILARVIGRSGMQEMILSKTSILEGVARKLACS